MTAVYNKADILCDKVGRTVLLPAKAGHSWQTCKYRCNLYAIVGITITAIMISTTVRVTVVAGGEAFLGTRSITSESASPLGPCLAAPGCCAAAMGS